MIEFNYDILDCENRDWFNLEDFTVTLTKDLMRYLRSNPPTTAKVNFRYTAEGTLLLVNGKWFMQAVHDFAHRHHIPLENITFIGSSSKIKEVYNKWHELYCSDNAKINIGYENFGFQLYQSDHVHFKYLKYTKQAPDHLRKNRYNLFNRNMLPHRIKFMNAMHENNLIDTETSITSFHYWPGIDDNPLYPVDPALLEQLPIQSDVKGDWDDIFNIVLNQDPSHPQGDWNKFGDYRYVYENSYFTITTEGGEDYGLADYHKDPEINDYLRSFHREMFITEKTTRPMINLHPQLIYATTGTLQYLKSLGFKTFSDYWNEDYDLEDNSERKLNMLIEEIRKLSAMPMEQLHEMYWDMMPILKHNQQLLLNGDFNKHA